MAAEQYMMMQRRALCIQTIEQEYLIDWIKHIVPWSLQNGYTCLHLPRP